MTYTSDSHIMSVKDVKTFFHHIVSERKVNFHPDDMFEDYVSCEWGINTFTLDECAIYNRLTDASFAVCKKDDVDIYEIGLVELQTALGIKTSMTQEEYLELEAERESIVRQIRELEDGTTLETNAEEILKEGSSTTSE